MTARNDPLDMTWHVPSGQADGQRVGLLVLLPELLREFGVEPACVVADSRLPADALDRADGRVPVAAVGSLLEAAARRTECDHFGLLLGLRFRLEHLGLSGQIALHAATVGDALRNLAVHQHLHSTGSVLFLTCEGDQATLGISLYDPSASLGFTQFHDAVAAMMINGVRELTAPHWRPNEILLSRRRPVAALRYRRALPAHLRFDSEFTGLRFPAELLATKVPTADFTRYSQLEQQIAAAGRASLLNNLRRALRIELIHGDTSADRVAQILELHRRTLNRRLHALGTTFQRILDEVRYDAARHLLRLTSMPLSQIAVSLGYGDVTAFNRAFRRWSGTTPGRHRAFATRLHLPLDSRGSVGAKGPPPGTGA